MNWKNRLEQNALVVVICACVATGATVAGVMGYYATEKIDLVKAQERTELMELKTQLASIARSMGHEEYLDVRKIVVAHDRVSPEPDSQYFDDAEFYAVPPNGDWAYSKSNEEELLKLLTGLDLSKDSALHNTATLAPIHLWRTKKAFSVQGDSAFKNVFPYVYLEKVSVNKFKESIGLIAAEDKVAAPTATQGEKTTEPDVKWEDYLDSLFRADVAGKFLTLTLFAQLSVQQEMPSELLNVQKVHNVVYIATRGTLRDIKIENTPYSHYYLYSEAVIISTGDDIIVIKTLLPSPDPSGNSEYFQYITRWFNGLRVLAG